MLSTFAAGLAAGCGGSPGVNPDARPVTDDGPSTPPPDAESDGGYCDPDIQECVDLGTDTYIPPDTDGPTTRLDAGADSGPDAGIPGVNYCLAPLPGPVEVLKSDPTTPSNVWAFTGPDGTIKPIKLSLCTSADTRFGCALKADFTDPDDPANSIFADDMAPVDFVPVPDNGFGFAVAAGASGSPTTVARVDQNTARPADAVPTRRHHMSFETWRNSSDWEVDVTYPNSAAAYFTATPTPPHYRFFLTFHEGIIGTFSKDRNAITDEITIPLRRTFPPGLSEDANPSSIFPTNLTIEGEGRDTLVILNSGSYDLSGRASILFLDPVDMELREVVEDGVDLDLRHAPVLKLDGDGTTAYIAFDRPTASLVHYDLETQEEITTIPLDGDVVGDIRAMDVSPARACIGDASGALVFVDLIDNDYEGYMTWPASPESILWHSGRGTFLVSQENCIGEANPPPDALRR